MLLYYIDNNILFKKKVGKIFFFSIIIMNLIYHSHKSIKYANNHIVDT